MRLGRVKRAVFVSSDIGNDEWCEARSLPQLRASFAPDGDQRPC
jgi:hypothetical protein